MNSKFIAGLLIAFIGSFLGALFAHLFSERRRRKEDFNKAVAEFRAAFVDIKLFLQENAETGTKFASQIVTVEGIISHERAKILFEPSLDRATLAAFNGAWVGYRESGHTHGEYGYIYSDSRSSEEENKAHSLYCLKHIDNLLSYALRK